MALLTAYLDESGIHRGDHWCVVAGFIGNNDQWRPFADEWSAAIKPRKNLHMCELPWVRHPHRVIPLLERVGTIPRKYNLDHVAVYLSWRDYKAVVEGNVEQPEFSEPYITCAMAAISVVLNEIVGSDDEVYFLFDRQEGLRRETMEAIRKWSFGYVGIDSRLKDVNFIPRHGTVLLDPGDVLAYTLHEQGTDRKSIKATAGRSIMDGPKHGGRIPAQYLRWMVDMNRNASLEDILSFLVQSPFFRGPKQQ